MTIEGLDDFGRDYPLDYVLIRNEARTIYDVLRRINAGQYIMDPDFQRALIWDERKQSKLIESVIKRIPLPAFYFAENRDGKMIVVDGLQRLWTFRRFVGEGSRLQLENDPELNGKRFSDLSARLQNQFEDFNLVVHVIDWRAPDHVKLDIFGRVNSGVPLTRQQMRNALYNGKGTRFLRREAETDLFKKVTGGSVPSDNMNDRELVNRFCAFQLLGVKRYRGDMDEFLKDAIVHMNKIDERDLNELGTLFRNGLDNNFRVFRRKAFRIPARRFNPNPISVSLWDVMVAGLSKWDSKWVNSHRSEIYEGFHRLIENNRFRGSITIRATNEPRAVGIRFDMSREMFERVLRV